MYEKLPPSEESNLRQKIEQAITVAPSLKEVERNDEKEAALLNEFISGKISLLEYHARSTHNDEPAAGEVVVPSMETLLESLKNLLHDEELCRELVDHEADHFNEAIRLGFPDTKILLRFFRENGELSVRAAIALMLPKIGDEDLIRRHLRVIIEAPAELSDIDVQQTKE
jgi:hypothetical protein